MTAPEAGALHAGLEILVDSVFARDQYVAKLGKMGNMLHVAVDFDRTRSLTRINITGPATPSDSVTAPLFRWVPGDHVLLIPAKGSHAPSRLASWELTLDAKEGGDNSGAARTRAILDVVFPFAWVAGAIAALVVALSPVFRREPPPQPITRLFS
jgi:hypothetical protein